MYQFIETIRFEFGKYHLLDYHQERISKTFYQFYQGISPIKLKEILPENHSTNKMKFRLEYSYNQYNLKESYYVIKRISALKLINSSIDYGYKFKDREELNQLIDQKDGGEIIIIKNGYLTDCSYANLCFWDGNNWYTPSTYLLNGVKRQYLLDLGEIHERQINPDDIKLYSKVCLINAMLDLEESTVFAYNIIE